MQSSTSSPSSLPPSLPPYSLSLLTDRCLSLRQDCLARLFAPHGTSPPSLPPSLLPLLPSLSASGHNQVERGVVAVGKLAGMEGGKEGKELFVNYGQDPMSVGYV